MTETMNLVLSYRKHLETKLDPMRYEHSLSVSYTCMNLAMRYGYDLDKAEIAGLLHDCGKRYSDEIILKNASSMVFLLRLKRKKRRLYSMQITAPGWQDINTECRIRRFYLLFCIIQPENRLWERWRRLYILPIILNQGGTKLQICRLSGPLLMKTLMKPCIRF